MVKAAIMGHGTVGSGVYEVFEMNAEKITRVLGVPVEVKYVLDLRDFSALPYGNKFVTDFSVIENDPEISVVAEVMGGVGAAYEFTKRCLQAGQEGSVLPLPAQWRGLWERMRCWASRLTGRL